MRGLSRAATDGTYHSNLGDLEFSFKNGNVGRVHYGSGWRVQIEGFHSCDTPHAAFDRQLLDHALESSTSLPKSYAWRRYGDTSGRAALGYCFRFDIAGLRIVVEASDGEPPDFVLALTA